MYIPKHFKIDDEKIIFDIIEENSFAILVSQHNGEPYATHLPLIVDRNNRVLYGHFARANTQWKDIQQQKVLIIFQGPHTFISPSWYETNTAVPTWNYVSVHIYGQVELVEEEHEVFEALLKMVDKYESPNSTYRINDVDPTYIKGLSKGIVGFKINIDRMEGKAKLSQNHPMERQERVIEQLEKLPGENNKKIAVLMKNNLK